MALLEVNQIPQTMKSYTSHVSEAAQNHQKKEDAPDTISKSVAFGLSFNATTGGCGSVLESRVQLFSNRPIWA
jgi:hypothetical protein